MPSSQNKIVLYKKENAPFNNEGQQDYGDE